MKGIMEYPVVLHETRTVICVLVVVIIDLGCLTPLAVTPFGGFGSGGISVQDRYTIGWALKQGHFPELFAVNH